MSTWTGRDLPALRRAERPPLVPLSFVQQRMWLLDQLIPDSSLYNTLHAVRLTGDLDVVRLEAALDAVVARHEILRTTYELADGVPHQVVHPHAAAELELIDVPPGTTEAEGVAHLEKSAQRPFDLARDVGLRATVVRVDAVTHLFLLCLPHVAADGWSFDVLFAELAELYAHPEAPDLPELSVQYADFALWQRSWADTPTVDEQVAYWRRHLADLPSSDGVTPDRPRPERQSYLGRRVHYVVPEDLTVRLRAWTRAHASTLYVVTLAAYARLLSRREGRSDVVIGTPVTGRVDARLTPLVGCFLNTLVVRLDVGAESSAEDLVSSTRSTLLEALAHQDVPFEKLVEVLQPDRDLSRSPLFQVMFIMQSEGETRRRFADLDLSPVDIQGETAKSDLVWSMEDHGSSLEATIEVATDLFELDTVARLWQDFLDVLEEFLGGRRATVAPATSVLPGRQASRAERTTSLLERDPRVARASWVTDADRRLLHLHLARSGLSDDECVRQLRSWRSVFDAAYGDAPGDGPSGSDDHVGWVSSYTRTPFSAMEMQAWADASARRILALAPRRVVEVGCGLGLIARRVAPQCELYVGTDVSEAALSRLRTSLPGVPLVTLCRDAADLDGLEEHRPDLVVVNSVAQYFPDETYLRHHIDCAIRLLPDGGHLFLGDIRNAALEPAFHFSVECASAGGSVDAAMVAERARTRLARDGELAVSPAWFHEYAAGHERVLALRVELRDGAGRTEMDRFRFDVTLRVGGGLDVPMLTTGQRDSTAVDPQRLAELLDQAGSEPLLVSEVVNQRVIADVNALRSLGDCPATEQPAAPVHDPSWIASLARRHGRQALLGWWSTDGGAGTFDAWLGEGQVPWSPAKPTAADGVARHGAVLRHPSSAPAARALAHDAFTSLLESADEVELPDEIRVLSGGLESGPLAGTVELARANRRTATPGSAGVGSTEVRIAAIWSDVLGCDVNLDDNFFDLGGHSLLLVQVRQRLAGEGVADLALVELFAHPTVRVLGRHLTHREGPAATSATGTVAADRRRAAMLKRRRPDVVPADARTPGNSGDGYV